MNKLVVASMRQGAGKTSVIIGMAKALGKKIGYMKPFGERLLYRKKRLWDYDAALITSLFKLEENPEDMSIGFHHAKLLYMLDEQATLEKLGEVLTSIGENKDLVFIEGGRDLSYGVSVHLDPLSVAAALDADWLVVVSGDGDLVLDDVTFLKKRLGLPAGRFRGVLINNVVSLATNHSLKTLMLTSSEPVAGKSTLLVYMAITIAQTGRRVVFAHQPGRRRSERQRHHQPDHLL